MAAWISFKLCWSTQIFNSGFMPPVARVTASIISVVSGLTIGTASTISVFSELAIGTASTISVASGLAIGTASTISVLSGLGKPAALTISGIWGITGEDISGLNSKALLVGIVDLAAEIVGLLRLLSSVSSFCGGLEVKPVCSRVQRIATSTT